MGTEEFGRAVVERLGKRPEKLPAVHYDLKAVEPYKAKLSPVIREKKELVGVDLYFDHQGSPEALAQAVLKAGAPLKLEQIFNRGVKVWPEGMPETSCIESWRCRFAGATPEKIAAALVAFHKEGLDCVKSENLYTFDDKPGYTLSQDNQ